MPRSTDHSAATITGRSFDVRRKGFDPDEVRAYLGQLAEVISRLTSERDEAQHEVSTLRTEAEVRPEIDEDQLTAALGEETARVLSSARKASIEIKERAEENVARMLREATEEVASLRQEAEAAAATEREEAEAVRAGAEESRRQIIEAAEAEANELREAATTEGDAAREAMAAEKAAAEADASAVRDDAATAAAELRAAADAVLVERTAEAEVAATEVRAQVEAEAEAGRERAEADAAAIRAQAERDRNALQAEGREMVAEAQRVRERMLADLSRKRKATRVQLEQLQAGRDRLVESYDLVQRAMDVATEGLRTALPEARQSAEAARMRAEGEPADTVEELEQQIAAARAAGLPLVAPAAGDETGADLPAEDEGPRAASSAEWRPPTTADGDDGDSGDADDDTETDADPAPHGAAGSAFVAAAEGDDDEEVEELFARLRASQDPADAAEPDVGSDPAAMSSVPAEASDGSAPVEDLEADRIVVDDDEPAPGVEESTSVAEDAADDVGDADDALVTLLERRDGAIEPLETLVARKLKRALADEQGQVLDGVRRSADSPDLDVILPQEDQVAAYAAAVVDDLVAAAEEGAAFEGASLPESTSLAAVAEELGRSLAGVVRPRVERCFATGEDAEDTSDRLRATYREWKTGSLIEATRHHVLAAFGEGQCAVRPAGSPVRWVPDPAGPACPDCEDDVLAGTVPSGDPFPTGHAHPPAHPGCRCLVTGERVVAPA